MTINITENARKQIESAAKASGAVDLPLRIATLRTPDGGLDYKMGFDDDGIKDGDSKDQAGSVVVVVSPEDQPILEGTTLDYVEIEQGQFHFIFDNPNDPAHAKKKSR